MCSVQGDVSPGFERVQEAFTQHFLDGSEVNAQCCVYYRGERVVDVFGSAQGDQSYHADSLQIVFSSTKVVTSIALACLVDQGLLDYEAPVSRYWPEFAQNGKDHIRVADVCRHDSGLHYFSRSLKGMEIQTESILNNSIGGVIEQEWPKTHKSGDASVRKYCAITRGWVLNEIFRRVDPQGRTMGQFIHDEFAVKRDIDVHIGLKDEDLPRLSPIRYRSKTQVLVNSLNPLTRCIEPSFLDLRAALQYRPERRESLEGAPPKVKAAPSMEYQTNALDPIEVVEKCLSRTNIIQGEIPSANGTCSARGLAKLASCMAMGGSVDGTHLMSRETCQKMQDKWDTRPDENMFGAITTYSQGGVHLYRIEDREPKLSKMFKNPLRNGWIGWQGLGGSVCQWHSELQIGLSYVPTMMAWEDLGNGRAARLQNQAMQCVQKIEHGMQAKM